MRDQRPRRQWTESARAPATVQDRAVPQAERAQPHGRRGPREQPRRHEAERLLDPGDVDHLADHHLELPQPVQPVFRGGCFAVERHHAGDEAPERGNPVPLANAQHRGVDVRGARFQRHMKQFVEELRSVIPAAFESDDYRNRIETLSEEFKQRQEKAFIQCI